MIGSQIVCIIGMFGMWVFMQLFELDAALYSSAVIFIVGFELGQGPIIFMYLSEICNDKATSVN